MKQRRELAKRAGEHPLPQDARLSFYLFRIRLTRRPARFYTGINSSQHRPEEMNPSSLDPSWMAARIEGGNAEQWRGAPNYTSLV